MIVCILSRTVSMPVGLKEQPSLLDEDAVDDSSHLRQVKSTLSLIKQQGIHVEPYMDIWRLR